MFRLFVIFSLLVPINVFAQVQIGHGNSSLLQHSEIPNLVSRSSSAKIVQAGIPVVVGFQDEVGNFDSMPFGIGVDVRPTRDMNVIQLLPEPPTVLAMSPSFMFALDPFARQAFSIGTGLNFAVPSLTTLAPGMSIRVQGVVLDPSFPNGMAFSNAVRFDAIPTLTPLTLQANTTQNYAFFGDSSWSADLNNDGFRDLIIGATRETSGNISNSGAVYLKFGPDFLVEQKIDAPHQQSCTGSLNCAEFGREVSAADITGDGVIDLIVAARGKTVNSKTRAGAVYLIPGPNFNSGSAIEINEPVVTGGADVSAWFGQIARPLDWNGDGQKDLLVTARKGESVYRSNPSIVQAEAGEAWIILGPITSATLQNSQVIHLRHLNDSVGPQFGYGGSTGDVNGDGRDDVVIGAYRYDSAPSLNDDTGAAFVFLSPSAPAISLVAADYVLQPALDEFGYFGHELVVDDFNNDGKADVAYAGEFGDSAVFNAGTVRVAFGPDFSESEIVVSSPQPRAGTLGSSVVSGAPGGLLGGGFGSDLASCDFNADGFIDLVIGEFYASRNGLDRSGAAWVFLGPSFEQALELPSDHLQNQGYDGRRVHCLPSPDGFGFAGVGAPYSLNGTGRMRLYSWQ